jgi:hypothetical protein
VYPKGEVLSENENGRLVLQGTNARLKKQIPALTRNVSHVAKSLRVGYRGRLDGHVRVGMKKTVKQQ